MNHSTLRIISFLLSLAFTAHAQINTFPYSESFSGTPVDWNISTAGGTSWEIGVPTAAGTIGTNSTPSCAGTDLDSGYRASSTSYLVSPRFDISGLTNPLFSFYQFRYMSLGLDGMHVEFSTDDNTWFQLGNMASPAAFNWYNSTSIFATGQPGFSGNSNGWIQSGYYLQGLTSGLIRFRFVFRSNINFGSAQPGVFVDDVTVEDSTNPIADILSSNNPGFSAPYITGVKRALYLRVTNYSAATTVDSANIGYLFNGVVQMNQYRQVNLPPGITDTLFVDSIILPQGNITIKSFLSYAGDPVHSNDTAVLSGTAYAYIPVPYFDDFETGTALWYAHIHGATTNWELGFPNFGPTTGTHSGTNAWDINLDTGYGYHAYSELYSPIFDLSGTTSYQLKFWQNCQSENSFDGTRLEYSTDGGVNWLLLGFQSDPLGFNWYTHNSIGSSGLPAWEGPGVGWIQSSYRLTNFTGTPSFRLRFIFTSDGVVNGNGFSIDDFEIITLPANDAVFLSLNNNNFHPVIGQNSGNIQIKFYNNGTNPITSFTASYSVNGVQQQSQLFNIFVNSGATIAVTLPGFTIPAGALSICGSVNIPLDADTSNNQGCFQTTGINTIATPYSDDFESGAPGWTTSTVNPTTMWELGTPAYGATSSTHSGSNCWDINLISAYTSSANATLYSPVFDVSALGTFKISFWINHLTEEGWDGARLEASIDGGASWSVVGTLADPYATNWYNDDFLVSSTLPGWCGNSFGWKKVSYRFDLLSSSTSIQFKFVFTSDPSITRDGFSIDDFSLTEIPAFDAEILEILPVTYLPPEGIMTSDVRLSIKNAGIQSFSGVAYGYNVNGTTQQSGVFPSTLLPMDTLTIFLPGYFPNTGSNDLCGFVHLMNDTLQENDTLCINTIGTPIHQPYFQDNFDGLDYGWNTTTTGMSTTQWQLGTPNYGQTNSAYSAPSSWDINLTTTYGPEAAAYLYSPWFDLSASVNPILTFRQNRNTDLYNAGFYLEWVTPGSSTWTPLGIYNDPSGTNWYNQTISSTFPSAFWDGSSNGWTQSTYPLTGVVPADTLVQFRFVFLSSTFTTPEDGVSIDNFNIEMPLNNDAELKSVVNPGPTAIEGSATPVEVLLRNNGLIPLTTLNLKYSLNNGPQVSSTWNGSLLYDSTTVAVLPAIYPIAGFNTLRIYIDWIADENHMNDTLDFSFTAIATSGIPYFTDFESGSGNWMSTNANQSRWEYGTPAFGSTSNAYSGDSCWDINLNTPYGNLANALLTSPIFDLGPSNIITLSFWHNYNTEFNADGMLVEYSTNGIVWQTLGSTGDPNGTNWYNTTIYQSNNGWSGNSGGWVNSQYIYYKPWNTNFFQLRFRFISDFNLVNAGVSVDDISLSGVVGFDETAVLSPFAVYPNPASDKLHLSGDVQNILLMNIYQSDGKLIWTGNVLPDVSSFAEGLYQLEIRKKTGDSAITKFAVSH